MLSFPCAKINLGLYVLNKRSDGYHNIASVFYPIPFFDTLEITEAKTFQLFLYGKPIKGYSEDNLVVKAYKLLHEKYKIPPVEIGLIKNIPMEAGMGGGSANAAFTLEMLNQLYGLKIKMNVLRELSKKIGADCPFFIQKGKKIKPAKVEGIGEKIKILPFFLKGKYIAIVNPTVSVSTKNAFKNIMPETINIDLASIVRNESCDQWKNSLVNRFEKQIFHAIPYSPK